MKSARAHELLRVHGLKVTDGRQQVLSVLMEAHEPLSIDAIASRVSGVNIVTVYRILDRLVERGIIYRTDFRDRKAFYEYQKTHHHHITCARCKRTEAVDICIGSKVREVPARTKHFSDVTGHVLEFFGVCNQCKTHHA